MRLLNKYTKEFKWFSEAPSDGYYILSHRWHGDETTMQSFELSRHLPVHLLSPGDAKIHKFCEMMQHEETPLEYVWVDSCCIDKTSSSDLQESINSMFKWYREAARCVVFLDDVDGLDGQCRTFEGSQWFTRGWCLQELLAPREQVFFNAEWQRLGDRPQLAGRIEKVTGIQSLYLGNLEAIHGSTIASRMSWMSGRTTTRTEDIAYALLGIFGIYMPVLYGEGGENAFLRLQKEIIQGTNDETIFAWEVGEAGSELHESTSGLLAPHPSYFQPDMAQDVRIDRYINRSPYHMTNKGLQIQKFGALRGKFDSQNILNLNCTYNGKRIQIKLTNVDEDVWLRSNPSSLSTVEDRTVLWPPKEYNKYCEYINEQTIKRSAMHNSAFIRQPKIDLAPCDFYDVFVKQELPRRKVTS